MTMSRSLLARRWAISLVAWLVYVSGAGAPAWAQQPVRAPVKIIFDTDIESDVDDVGAVAVLHALANRGEAEILAMGVSAGNEHCAPCLDALNTFFGRPDIPIGAVKGPSITNESKYAARISAEFPHDLKSNADAPDAAHVYRSVLAKQPDHSVVIVSVGFLTNLRNLLKTGPDGHSPLDGRALVAQKVKAWVCMGAAFPQGREWNIFRDAGASRETIEQWPTPVVFSGYEIGKAIKTGSRLKDLPASSAVRRAYELYNGLRDRESWDQTAVLFAVRGWDGGTSDLWDVSEEGCCVVAEDGSNTWQAGGACRHRHLIAKAPPEQVAKRIEDLMLAAHSTHTSYDVGIARVDVTPDYPIRLNGFGFRREESQGVTQRIWAKAMALRQADQPPVVLVTLDSLGIRESMLLEVVERVREKTGVTRERLVVAFSHSHTTPKVNGASDTIFSSPIPPEHQAHIDRYTRELTDALEKVVLEAVADLRPARLEWGVGTVKFAINRRTPGGPVDHDLPVLVVRDERGGVRAIYCTYACHCVTLSHNQISGDWAGFAQELMERKFPNAVALVSIGCGSDSNPSSGVKGDRVDLAASQGAEIADEVERVLSTPLRAVSGDLTARLTYVDLPLEPAPTREQLRSLAEQSTPAGYNARFQLARLERGEPLTTSIHYPVQSFTFGESLHMVFLAGEVCVDYALRLKKEFDRQRLWLHGYCNDFCAYIPSERLLREGGYGGGSEIVYFALPSKFQSGLEQKIVDAVREITPMSWRINGSTQGVAPRSPADSIAAMRFDPALHVELVAAEPLVEDPVAIDFGVGGELWVAEMPDYSREVDETFEPHGRIKRLTDSDGDGRYDQASVFLGGLRFPTGVTVWRDGVLVCDAPSILFARDTDGDGVADDVRTLYTGFATHNPHARVNGLRYGLDGWVYGSGGLFGGDITSFRGDKVALQRSDFRIRPDEGAIEPATGVTQQSRVRDDWDNWFGCDNGTLARHYPVFDHYVRRNRFAIPPAPQVNIAADAEAARLYPAGDLVLFKLSGQPGRATSACGIEVYRDTYLGEQYYGNVFTCEPVHQAVHRLVLRRNGATFRGYRAEEEAQREFLSSTDQWFRPVQVRTGPDGALWIVDMYRYVIEHKRWIPPEVTARLDVFAGTTRGRIYRLRRRDVPPRDWPRPIERQGEALARMIDHPNGVVRDLVQQQIVWTQDAGAVPGLKTVVRQGRFAAGRLQALAALNDLGRLDDTLLSDALHDEHSGVRRHAVRIAGARGTSHPELARSVAGLVDDPAYEVRYQCAYTLGDLPAEIASEPLARLAAAHVEDPYLQGAVQSSLTEENAPGFLTTLMALARSDAAVRSLLPSYVGLAVELGGNHRFGDMLALIANGEDAADQAAWRFTALQRLLEARKHVTQDPLSEQERAQLEEWANRARRCAANDDEKEVQRAAALGLLGTLARAEDMSFLAGFLEPRHSTVLQQAALDALGRSARHEAAPILLQAWHGATPTMRRALLDTLLSRGAWTESLLEALEQQRIASATIDASQRQRLLQHQNPAIRQRAERAFHTAASSDRMAVLERYRDAARHPGDAARGRAIFQKHCSVCHRLGDTGYAVGPDLSALANKSPLYLLIALLDPHREVEGRYQSYIAVTHDGRTFTGILANETGTSVTLLEQEGKQHVLRRADLEGLLGTGKSLMPEGLEKDLDPQQVADVIALLMSLGPPPKKLAGNTPAVITPDAEGHLVLDARHAEIYGRQIVFEMPFQNIGYWHDEQDHASWQVQVPRAGPMEVWIEFACAPDSAGNAFRIDGFPVPISGTVASTGGWDQYQRRRVATVAVEEGVAYITVRPDGPLKRGALFDLRSVTLVPVPRTE